MAVRSATDIIPNLFETENITQNADTGVYDLFNLTLCNHDQIIVSEDRKEDDLLEFTRVSTQALIQRIFECPIEKTEVGPVAVLPSEKFRLPREKRIPDPKPETRWEKFAKEKGIKKRKRERMVYDDVQDEFRPRFGYKRANNGIEEMAIVEVKNGQDPMADPWSVARTEKKKRVEKNEKNQMQNKLRAVGKGGKNRTPRSTVYDSASVPGIPVDMVGAKPKNRGKDGVQRALQLVQHSTASMGRFDEMRQGEPVRKMKGKKRAFRDNFEDSTKEKDVMKAQIRIVADKLDKKLKGVTNSLAAYEGILPDAPSDSFRQKKGKGRAKPAAGSSEKGGGKKRTGKR